jgi:hypothetical protein
MGFLGRPAPALGLKKSRVCYHADPGQPAFFAPFPGLLEAWQRPGFALFPFAESGPG